jgi:protease-4
MDTGPNPQPTRQSASQSIVQPELVSSASAAATPAPQIIIQQSGGRLSRLLSWLGWAGLLFCIPLLLGMYAGFHEYFDTTGGIQEKYHSLAKYGTNKVAVITIEGVIMDGDGFVKRQIDRVTDDDDIKAVVIRIDSPGGTVNGSDFIYHHLRKLRQSKAIPMVVSMGGMAASGGYYIAMAVGDQERSIFAEPTTTTGSIGVIIPHYDLSGLLQRWDIKDDSIASNPRKQMLSMTKATSAEDREILKRYVHESFLRFKEIVRSGRPAFERDQQALDQLATGEIFSAQQAKEHGLVDEIGFVEDAIDRAIELAQLPRDTVRVVTYRRMPNLFSMLGYHQAEAHPLETLSRELAMPRAFYLATTWPTLIRSDSP